MNATEFKMRPEEPPPKSLYRSGSKRIEAAEFAKAHPGQWCAVAEYTTRPCASQTAYHWKSNAEPGIEFKSGQVKVGKRIVYRVYCRYTPPATPGVATPKTAAPRN